MNRTIQEQVKLPLPIAFGVVLQGIRIRFGRSLVTIMGVVLGIAFLMSILTSQLIKDGVRAETDLRVELKRMLNFLSAEIGTVEGRAIYLVKGADIDQREERFIKLLTKEGAKLVSTQEQAAGIVVVGKAEPPAASVPVFVTRQSSQPGIISLDRELKPEEKAKLADQARQSRSRTIWIVAISLLVTVIGISNAMLMSVTERFREIGTMKCLGALSAFIRQIFFIESSLVGLAGSLAGSLAGVLIALLIYSITYGIGMTFGALQFGPLTLYFILAVVAGMLLSIVAAIYPANFASRMVPAHALRSNV